MVACGTSCECSENSAGVMVSNTSLGSQVTRSPPSTSTTELRDTENAYLHGPGPPFLKWGSNARNRRSLSCLNVHEKCLPQCFAHTQQQLPSSSSPSPLTARLNVFSGESGKLVTELDIKVFWEMTAFCSALSPTQKHPSYF